MTVVIGIDPSSKKIALVARHDLLNIQIVEAFPLYGKGQTRQSPESIYAAMAAMQDVLVRISAFGTNSVAFLEAPVVGRGGINTTMKQAYVGGVIQACLIQAGCTVHVVHPSTWRKGLGIKARESKAIKTATARYVKTKWPKVSVLIDGDGDLTDAAAICIYGTNFVRDSARPPAANVAGR